jgi:hypothetical protein
VSEENVAQQYRAANAFSRQDLDGFLAICDPEIVLVSRHLELDGSGHLRGKANGSGAQLEQRHWQVTRWRDAKAIWWQSLPTEAEALEVAGAPD